MKKILATVLLSLAALSLQAEVITAMVVGGLVFHSYQEHKRNDKQDSGIQQLTDSNNQLVEKVREHDTKIDKLDNYCFPQGNGSI